MIPRNMRDQRGRQNERSANNKGTKAQHIVWQVAGELVCVF